MGDIASNYARGYQAKLETTGHLFERRFMDVPIVDGDDAMIADGDRNVLGSDEFSARLLNKSQKMISSGRSLQQLLVDACAMFDISEAQLMSNLRTQAVVQARAWVALNAVKGGSASLSEVARVLGRDRATLRYAIRQHSEALNKAV